MKEGVLTKFLTSFNGRIDYVIFPGGVFDDHIFLQYEVVWGPDWDPISGLSSGTSQMASSGRDAERVVFNLPLEMVFSSTNVHGWPRLIITVKAHNAIGGESLRGYAVVLLPPTSGERELSAPLVRPRPATVLGEWLAWLTGRYPELADPKMLANGKENYLLRTESYGSIHLNISMVSKDLRKLGYDNQASTCQSNCHR
ncbi:B9 domain-containing protein 1 [Battus philenor]|uniref:B9 domain-containing protein 1 n=1 Tax=Battus philenor TaxID=42288 RepID=UPI0035CF1179